MDSSGRMPWMRIVTPEEAASSEWKARKARDAFRARILETLDMIAVMRDYTRLRPRGRITAGRVRFIPTVVNRSGSARIAVRLSVSTAASAARSLTSCGI